MCYFYLTYRKLIQADSGLPSSTHLHESMQRVAPDYCNLTCRPVPAVYGHLEPAKRYIGNFSAEKKNGGPSHLSILSIVPNSYPRGGTLVLYGIMLTLVVRVRHVRNPSHWFQFPFPPSIAGLSHSLFLSPSLCLSVPFSVQRAFLYAPCMRAVRRSAPLGGRGSLLPRANPLSCCTVTKRRRTTHFTQFFRLLFLF